MKEFIYEVKGIRYEDDRTNFKILRGKVIKEDNLKINENMTVVGDFGIINTNDTLKIYGEYTNHYKFGRQIQSQSYEITEPVGIDMMKKFLISYCKGVGEITAKNIVDKYGLDTLSVIKSFNGVSLISTVKGVSNELANNIREDVLNSQNEEKFLQVMNRALIPVNRSINIYKDLGSIAMTTAASNPYDFMKYQVSFEEADRLAKYNTKLKFDSPERIDAAIIEYIRSEITNGGHMYIDLDEIDIVEEVQKITPNNVFKEKINGKLIHQAITVLSLPNSQSSKFVLHKNRYLYFTSMDMIEEIISLRLNNMINDKIYIDKNKLTNKLKDTMLSDEQKDGILKGLGNRVSVITGGAGVGKTTLLSEMINVIEGLGKSYTMLAPTGKASNQMEEATGREASTIHRKLKLLEDFDLAEVIIEEDYIIVDEASMIDANLFLKLLNSIDGGSLILIGDYNQLPSVGAGLVLRDVIDSNVVPTTRLTKVFRQGEDSKILSLAEDIIDDKELDLNNADGFTFIETKNDSETYEKIMELYKDVNMYDIENGKIQTLSTMRKGKVGINNLNCSLQKLNKINNQYKDFKVGDPVIHIKNNYDLNVYNGDTGVVKSIEDEIVIVDYEDNSVSYKGKLINEIELAYALTVHKSQGSEFDKIILPISHTNTFMNDKNLLYTAITRSKTELVIIGSKEEFRQGCKELKSINRRSRLKERLIEKQNK